MAEYSTLETVVAGVGTVFFGLICLIIIIQIMHALVAKFYHGDEKAVKEAPKKPQTAESDIDHNTLVALCAAAVAEQLGKDVDAIRVVSIRKL